MAGSEAGGRRRPNVLVVYSAYPTRATLQDALYSFGRYADARVAYLNLRLKKVPWYVTTVQWDLVVFHMTFFSGRFDAAYVRRTFARAAALARLRAVKVMLPQDEFINNETVNGFIRDFGIDAVFTVMPEWEWSTVYDTVPPHVRLYQVLTGYLDERRMREIERIRAEEPERPIDIGYRTAGRPLAWFGRHGYLKQRIAEVFAERAPAAGVVADISTEASDTLLGNDWYRFLCRCKYILGVEGGTSILDRDGSIHAATERYRAAHPDAGFEEIEAACFPGVDGRFRGFMISPRHLEACAAGACQILTEGGYNGILQPGRHYIELKRDFSNVDQVLELVRSDCCRRAITERAYDDIVRSGRYTYRSFVDTVIGNSLPPSVPLPRLSAGRRAWAGVVFGWMRAMDALDRLVAVLHTEVVNPLRQRVLGR